jgi:hypothetical protein
MGQCEVDPGSFECQGSCFADCTANAEGSCSASNNQGECRASVEATCDAQCQVSCESTPTTVDCAGECMASCEGSCSASGTAYLDCQVDCQAQGHAECKADLQGGCEVDCDTEQGALFCDGNYVDHGGNLEECVAALRAIFNIEVTGYAEGRCEGNTCSGEAGFSCTVAGDRKPGRDAAWLTLSGLFLFGLATRTARYA